MATPDSESFTIPPEYITEYCGGESKRLQKGLDDALIRAHDNSAAEGVAKQVIINIQPTGATVSGATSQANWSNEICREYLWPPGNSMRMQSDLENRMIAMGRSATNNFTITQVIIQVAPT
jgi:hypothetical protein